MTKKSAGTTALSAAICRLIEQYQPEKTRLFYDPVIKELVDGPVLVWIKSPSMRDFTVRQTDAIAKGIYGVQVCRTRYIDEVVQAAISQEIKQVVILGAGYDTRPYRMLGIENMQVFEVDLPAVQDDKKKKLRKYLGRLPDHVSFIPIDFDTQTLEDVFFETTLDLSKPVLFIWEGVTQYITEQAICHSLSFIGRSKPGSIVVFTYVLKSIIDRRSDIPGADQLMDVAATHSPWVFGLEPSGIPDFLRPFHLDLLSDVGNEDYQENYLKPIARELVVFEGERIVKAMVI